MFGALCQPWAPELVQGVLDMAELSPEMAFGDDVIGEIVSHGTPYEASVWSRELSRYLHTQPFCDDFQHLPVFSRLMLRNLQWRGSCSSPPLLLSKVLCSSSGILNSLPASVQPVPGCPVKAKLSREKKMHIVGC